MTKFIIHTVAGADEDTYEVEATNYNIGEQFIVFSSYSDSNPLPFSIRTSLVSHIESQPE